MCGYHPVRFKVPFIAAAVDAHKWSCAELSGYNAMKQTVSQFNIQNFKYLWTDNKTIWLVWEILCEALMRKIILAFNFVVFSRSVLEQSDTDIRPDGAICERHLRTDSLNRSRVKPVSKHWAPHELFLIVVQWTSPERSDSANLYVNILATVLSFSQFQRRSNVEEIWRLKLMPNICD